MPEPEVLVDKETESLVSNPFSDDKWNAQPTATDPVIDEKDQKIKEEKPISDKPNEPEKIPGATPAPIQNRPDEVKEDVKPTEVKKFANEESEKVYNLLVAGEVDKVLSILSEQKKLAEVDKLPAADIIKLNLQYQNKDFSADDITDLFNERYALPEQPEQKVDETDDEFKSRTEKYEKEVQKVENRIKRDAKPATTELLKLQKEIVLPDIPKTKTEATINEPTQEELDAQKIQAEKFLQTVDDGLKKFNGYGATYKDEEVEIPVAYTLTEEEKKQIQPLVALSNSDAVAFLTKIGWLDEKGNINTTKLTEDLPLILYKEKVLQKIVSETGNKRHEASIKSIKNIDYSGPPKSNGELGATPQEKQEKMAKHFLSE